MYTVHKSPYTDVNMHEVHWDANGLYLYVVTSKGKFVAVDPFMRFEDKPFDTFDDAVAYCVSHLKSQAEKEQYEFQMLSGSTQVEVH